MAPFVTQTMSIAAVLIEVVSPYCLITIDPPKLSLRHFQLEFPNTTLAGPSTFESRCAEFKDTTYTCQHKSFLVIFCCRLTIDPGKAINSSQCPIRNYTH